jgi:hypothetical protein
MRYQGYESTVEKPYEGTAGRWSCTNQRREASGDTKPADILILDLLPKNFENKCPLFKLPGHWYFVMASPGNF